MIYTLKDLIGSEDVKSSLSAFSPGWVRAVPLQFYSDYVSAAWAVLRGRAVAVRYPMNGELEQALAETGGIRVEKSR
jgi:hypothetical protein